MQGEQKTGIYLNGIRREVPEGYRVEDLVIELGHTPELVAVEINRHLVPRGARAQRTLEPEDRVEVVTLVGGG